MSYGHATVQIQQLAHIGIRVMAFDPAVRFYKELGFEIIRWDSEGRVVVLGHASGLTLNLLDSGNDANGGDNVLMDVPARYPGYTHMALQVADIDQAVAQVQALGVTVTEGPITFGDGSTSIFFRDPDRNVIELSQPRI